MRSLSHAANQRSDSTSRTRHGSDNAGPDAGHCRCGAVSNRGGCWRKRPDRSFGQVLTDVFRVPSISDVSTEGKVDRARARARLQMMARDMAALTILPMADTAQRAESEEDKHPATQRPIAEGRRTSTGFRQPDAAPPQIATHSSDTSPAGTDSRPESRRTSYDHSGSWSRGGPQVNVLEPTPVPSRVGSIGDAANLSLHPAQEQGANGHPQMKAAADAGSTGNAGLPPRAPAASRIGAGLAPLTAMAPARATPASPPAKSTANKTSERTSNSPSNRSAGRKKDKKSIFFIQSPGQAGKQTGRQGSGSGSEGSLSTNSVGPHR